jgi:hypothetical protein
MIKIGLKGLCVVERSEDEGNPIEHRASYTPQDVDLEAFQPTLRIALYGVAVRTTVCLLAYWIHRWTKWEEC